MNSRFETPAALKHDVSTLADEARALMEATADVADEKVTEARKRLETCLAHSKTTLASLREKASQGAKVADETVRSHPYEAIAVAFGVGALVGFLISRR